MSGILESLSALPNLQLMVLGAVFAVVVLFVMGIALALDSKDPMSERLQRLGGKNGRGGGSLRNERSGAGVEKLLAKVGANVIRDDARTRSTVGRRLVQAGYRSPRAVPIFYGTRIALAIALPALSGIAFYMGVAVDPEQLFLIMMGSVAVGFYLPLLWLTRTIQSRREDVRNGFPDALDMLLVCVEAGASLPAALERVSTEIGRAHPVLSEELNLMALEINAGTGRAHALRRFAERVGADDVTAFVTLLTQSDALGTSIADSLRVQADDMRRKRMIRAEEKANKLPVKIALPLVLFIFPALLIVIMTPVIIRILEAVRVTT